MQIIIFIIIGIIIGLPLGYLAHTKVDFWNLLEKAKTREKEQILEALLAYAHKHREFMANDLVVHLKISHTSAIRYLDILEKEKKIRQIGITKGTHYKLIENY